MTDTLLDTPTVATLLGLTEGTLRKWRLSGQGPIYVKLGSRSVRDRRSDLDNFVADRRSASTAHADMLIAEEVEEAF